MEKYYTRACNFYYGSNAKTLIKKNSALPLCGNKLVAFDKIEVFERKKNTVTSKIIKIKEIKSLKKLKKKKILIDLKNIILKRNLFSNPTVMGIINMTPDSFSDGGQNNTYEKAINKISQMINSGANIIDVGGESTRPGSSIIKSNQEWKRIEKVVKIFKKKFPQIQLSIDTRKSEIIEKSIKFNADIINDVSCFDYDPRTIDIIKKTKLHKVIHHMQGTPQNMQNNPKYNHILLDIYDFFEKKIALIKNKKKIILDPGIGFGKNLKHNLMLINKISLFHSLGFPILIGTSRKKFISQISKKFDTQERIGGTLSSVLFALSQGVQIYRVHNIEEVKQAILVFEKILKQ